MPYKNREKRKEYQRLWIAKRRSDWLQANGPCIRCSSWEKLELDHIDSTKKVSHNIWSWTVARRDVEISKCQVLCRDCHIKKGIEAGDIQPLTDHGQARMYTTQKCRCDLCMAWVRSTYPPYSSEKRRAKYLKYKC